MNEETNIVNYEILIKQLDNGLMHIFLLYLLFLN